MEEEIKKFEIPKLAQNKKIFSHYIRQTLDISLKTQKSWSGDEKHYSFLNNWNDIISKKFGILILK